MLAVIIAIMNINCYLPSHSPIDLSAIPVPPPKHTHLHTGRTTTHHSHLHSEKSNWKIPQWPIHKGVNVHPCTWRQEEWHPCSLPSHKNTRLRGKKRKTFNFVPYCQEVPVWCKGISPDFLESKRPEFESQPPALLNLLSEFNILVYKMELGRTYIIKYFLS